MTRITLTEAQQRLPELLAAAAAGEGVVIAQDNGWTFRLLPMPPSPPQTPRPATGFGCCQSLIWMADDFDAPLDDLREYME